MGKTRLALRVASAVQREYDDGVWLVELGDLREESLLVDWWPPRWGCETSRRGRYVTYWSEFLAPRELLLVLDNCEHVVDAVAEFAETLLRAARGCGSWPPAANRSVSAGRRCCGFRR